MQGTNEDQNKKTKWTHGIICRYEKADEPELESSDLDTENPSSDDDRAESTDPIKLEFDTDVDIEFLFEAAADPRGG